MKRASDILGIAIKAVLLAVLVVTGLLLFEARSAVKEVKSTVASVNTAVGNLERQLYDKGGIFDIAQKTMLHVDRVTGEAAIAARQQRALSEKISIQTLAVLRDADNTILNLDHSQSIIAGDVHASLENLDAALQGLPPLLKAGKDVVDEGQRTLASANTLLSDPQIQQTIHHVNGVAGNLEKVSASGAGIAKDVQGVVHKKANPTTTQKVEDQILFGLKTSFYLSWLFK